MLNRIGYQPDLVVSPNVDESINSYEKPRHYVNRLAFKKAEKVSLKYKDCFILAADTVIVSGGKIYGQARSKTKAFKTLQTLEIKDKEILLYCAAMCSLHRIY